MHPYTFRPENNFLPHGLPAGEPGERRVPARRGNQPAELKLFYKLGVDGVFADNPDTAGAVRTKVCRPACAPRLTGARHLYHARIAFPRRPASPPQPLPFPPAEGANRIRLPRCAAEAHLRCCSQSPGQVAGLRRLVRRHLPSFGFGVPEKYTDAQENESTSFLPGDAESTKALLAAEDLQGGELAPAVILYRRESGLTAADKQKIVDDVGRSPRSGSRASSRTARRPPAVAAVADAARRPPPAEGCGGPTTPIPGQPSDYAPFVGPRVLAGRQGRARLRLRARRRRVATLLDPIAFWRETVSDPGGGLEVKITGGAGYAADAIEVFENINGTLLGAATLLVIVLLILIYRSPIFLFIPLAAVLFAESLSQTLGYGLAELGVTINGQSSAIMSILVLGAGRTTRC